MPTKRRRLARGRITLTLLDIGIRGRLDFTVGWAPPGNAFERTRSRWTTYRQYLDDYTAVRDEMLARHPRRPEDFAETLYERVGSDPRGDVETIGAALDRKKFGGS